MTSSNSFYVQTSESEYEDIYPNFAKEAKVSVPVVPILKSITGDSQLSSVPHIWGLSYYGEDSSYYIKCGACQFEAYDATGNTVRTFQIIPLYQHNGKRANAYRITSRQHLERTSRRFLAKRGARIYTRLNALLRAE